jgi:hypothetical protein
MHVSASYIHLHTVRALTECRASSHHVRGNRSDFYTSIYEGVLIDKYTITFRHPGTICRDWWEAVFPPIVAIRVKLSVQQHRERFSIKLQTNDFRIRLQFETLVTSVTHGDSTPASPAI